ncbi:MAG: DegV family protein [Tissierellia bacterium]|nr:DegV family protein [Tissierellia bacterium]
MIKIFADDGADIPEQYLREYDIQVLPIAINDGEREYYAGVDLDYRALYEGMRQGKNYKTSQVAFQELEKRFTQTVEAGDIPIYIPLSSGISGTYQTALSAKEEVLERFPESEIHIVDSLSAAFGHGMVVLRAAKMAKDGRGVEEILEALLAFTRDQDHLFTVETLEYLYRGGRVSRTSKVVGGLLNIKPILNVDKESGALVPIDRVRGPKHIYSKICEWMIRRSEGGVVNTNQTFAICHGDWPQAAEGMKDALIRELGVPEENILISFVGPVIGAHTGPEILCVFYSTAANGDYGLIPPLT